MIVSGQRLYGRVDNVPGLAYVATMFFHVGFVPLIPLRSYVVLDRSESIGALRPSFPVGLSWEHNFQGYPIGLALKSVLSAWLRACLLVVMIGLLGYSLAGCVVYLNPDASSRPTVGGILTPMAGGCVCLVLLRLSRRLTRASVPRARELAAHAGLDVEQAAKIALDRPPVAKDRGLTRHLPAALAVLILGSGLILRTDRARTLSVEQARDFIRRPPQHGGVERIWLQSGGAMTGTICIGRDGVVLPAARAAACYVPVQNLEQELYAKTRPGSMANLSAPLLGVLKPKGEVALNKALGGDRSAPRVAVLDLPEGARAAKTQRHQGDTFAVLGALLLFLLFLWRVVPE